MLSPSSPPEAGSKLQFRLVLAATIAALVVPLLLDLAVSRLGVERRLFAYAAPDTFYYLTVARNIGLHGRFAFDGEHLSNGYHPLWQLACALPYALRLPRADTPWVLAYLLAMAVTFQALALGFLARALRRPDGTLSWLFVFLPVGVYALCVSPAWLTRTLQQVAQENPMEGAQPVYGTWLSYLNGMETSLVLLFFGLVLWLAVRPSPLDRPVRFGLALAGLTLARLDHALIAVPLLLGLCVAHLGRAPRGPGRLKPPALALASFAAPLVAYLTINRVFFGAAMPVSGALKSPFPYLTTDNVKQLADSVNRLLAGQPTRVDTAWRVLQLAVPALFALVTPLVVARFRLRRGRLVVTWAGPDPRLAAALLLVATGVLWLAAYDFLFVYFYGAGHWYVPVSTVFTSLVCLFGVERARLAWKRWRAHASPGRMAQAASALFARVLRFAAKAPARTPVAMGGAPPAPPARPARLLVARIAVALATGTLAGYTLLWLHRCPNYHLRFANFAIDEAPRVRAHFANQPVRIIDCDDAIIAWAVGFPSMSGIGLALDVEAARAKVSKEGLLPLAIARGYTYVTALVYIADPKGPPSDAPEQVKEWVARMGPYTQLGDVRKYRWSVAYRSQKRDFSILKVSAP